MAWLIKGNTPRAATKSTMLTLARYAECRKEVPAQQVGNSLRIHPSLQHAPQGMSNFIPPKKGIAIKLNNTGVLVETRKTCSTSSQESVGGLENGGQQKLHTKASKRHEKLVQHNVPEASRSNQTGHGRRGRPWQLQ